MIEYLGRIFQEAPEEEADRCTGCDLHDPTMEFDEYHLCDQIATNCTAGRIVYKEVE